MNPAVITCALTGPIATKADNRFLPTSPREIAESARQAYEAGAAVVHVHLRDDMGRPTASLDVAQRTIDMIEDGCPALVQLSTGVGLNVPFAERCQLVEAKPRMATLNVCSMTFGDGEFRNPPHDVRRLAARMGELGIKPELEIYDTGHLEVALRLVEEGLLIEPLQFSIVMGVIGGMPATPRGLLEMVDRLPSTASWQVVAIGRWNLPMMAVALGAGGNARTGMEDTLMVRRGVPASANAELVERAINVAMALDRPPATVEQAESLLGLVQGQR